MYEWTKLAADTKVCFGCVVNVSAQQNADVASVASGASIGPSGGGLLPPPINRFETPPPPRAHTDTPDSGVVPAAAAFDRGVDSDRDCDMKSVASRKQA